MKRLNIFIDESGDFGFGSGSSELYIVSLTFHEISNSIEKEIDYLNKKLNNLGYNKMIHSALLIAKRGDYTNFHLEKRKEIFWTLFSFFKRIKIKIKTVLINKKYLNTRSQLNKKILDELEIFLYENEKYFSSFDEIVIYYDNGQETLSSIIDIIFSKYSNVVRKSNFDHTEKKLFQVSDMLTVIDKYNYKYQNKLNFNKSEKYFFELEEMKKIMKEVNKKRFM